MAGLKYAQNLLLFKKCAYFLIKEIQHQKSVVAQGDATGLSQGIVRGVGLLPMGLPAEFLGQMTVLCRP